MIEYRFNISMFFKESIIRNGKESEKVISRINQMEYPNIYNTFIKPSIRDYITYISDCRTAANKCIRDTQIIFIDDAIEVVIKCDRELSFSESGLIRYSLENLETMDFINNPLFISKKTKDKIISIYSDRCESYIIQPVSVVAQLID